MFIILYIMDCLRSDFLSCYGYGRETSPRLDALAQSSVLFENAFAQSTWTKPEGASLLSSTYPSVHGVNTMSDMLPAALPVLPEVLRGMGFRTLGISTNANIAPAFGFGSGFDEFIELYKSSTLRERSLRCKLDDTELESILGLDSDEFPITTSEHMNECLFGMMPRNEDEDVFAFMWSIDTHDPYFQRDKALARFSEPSEETLWVKDTQRMRGSKNIGRLRALYEDMVYYNDYHLGLLVDELKRRNLFDRTLLVVTGDHGEAFGEHGVNSHAGLPYDEQIKVPLIMKFPGSLFGGTRVDALVQHIDIGPTVLDFVKKEEKNALLQGRSLLPLLKGGEKINDFVFVETQRPKNATHNYAAIRTQDYKYIDFFPLENRPAFTVKSVLERLVKRVTEGKIEKRLFSLATDPAEHRNIYRKRKDKADEFAGQIRKVLEENRAIAENYKESARREVKLDDETAKQLKALGYFE